MRMIPIMISFHFICGIRPGWFETRMAKWPLDEVIEEGRKGLAEMTGKDFEYDLSKWHEYLVEQRVGGYTYHRSHGFPKIARAALRSSDGRNAWPVCVLLPAVVRTALKRLDDTARETRQVARRDRQRP